MCAVSSSVDRAVALRDRAIGSHGSRDPVDIIRGPSFDVVHKRCHPATLPREERRGARCGRSDIQLSEHAEVLWPALHRVNEFLGPVVPYRHHDFKQAALHVKTKTEKTLRILVVQWGGYQRPRGGRNRVILTYPMLECRLTDDHAAWDQAASAALMASDRFRCSRSARAMIASSSSAVSRTGTTCEASVPRAGRPIRAFSCSTS